MLELNLVSRAQADWGEGVEFFGELSNEQFASYAEVSSLTGVTNGTLHNEGQGWLRFELDGKELIVSKKTIRYNISWDQINSAGCVFGEKVIIINNQPYMVRLLKGADENPAYFNPNTGYYVEGSHNSEWSRLFYPIIKDTSNIPLDVISPNASYLSKDVGIVNGNGGYSWCQETIGTVPTYRVTPGYSGPSYIQRHESSRLHTALGWRPVLEALPPVLPPEPKAFYYYHPDVTFFGPTNVRGNYVSDLSELGIL